MSCRAPQPSFGTVSFNTIHSQTKSLHAKLDASSREEAQSRCRHLTLRQALGQETEHIRFPTLMAWKLHVGPFALTVPKEG